MISGNRLKGWAAIICTVSTPFAAGLIQVVCVKTGCSHMALCGHNSGTECAGELFKPSTDSTSLLACNEKNFFGFGFRIFCEWRYKWSTLRPLWPTSPGPWSKPLNGNISLKFLLETRLKQVFWYFGWLLGFRVQKLLSKVNPIID